MTRLRVTQPSGVEFVLPCQPGTKHVGSAISQYKTCEPVQFLLGPEVRKVNQFVLEELTNGSWIRVAEWKN